MIIFKVIAKRKQRKMLKVFVKSHSINSFQQTVLQQKITVLKNIFKEFGSTRTIYQIQFTYPFAKE